MAYLSPTDSPTGPWTSPVLSIGFFGTLAFSQLPSVTALSGIALTVQPIIQVLNAKGQLDTSYSGNVTVSLQGAGSLSGTLSVTVTAGLATFVGLTITGAGTSNLVFSAPTRGTLVSAAITTT